MKNACLGQFLAKLGFIDYHCVASSTNYTREWINSKIVVIFMTENCLLGQLTDQTFLCLNCTNIGLLYWLLLQKVINRRDTQSKILKIIVSRPNTPLLLGRTSLYKYIDIAYSMFEKSRNWEVPRQKNRNWTSKYGTRDWPDCAITKRTMKNPVITSK